MRTSRGVLHRVPDVSQPPGACRFQLTKSDSQRERERELETETERERDRDGDPMFLDPALLRLPMCFVSPLLLAVFERGGLGGSSHPEKAPQMRCRVQGSGLRVQGSGFRVQGAGFRVQGSRFKVQGSGCRVQGAGFRV